MRRSLFLAAALLALTAGQALAHAQLVKADPRVGATIQQPPRRIWLRFDQIIRLEASGVMLTGPDGRQTLLQPLARDPGDVQAVTAPLPAGLPAGRYKVEWRALSPDGHRTQGDFVFTVAQRP
jgi:methionine-rich copper-binding protein CopC